MGLRLLAMTWLPLLVLLLLLAPSRVSASRSLLAAEPEKGAVDEPEHAEPSEADKYANPVDEDTTTALDVEAVVVPGGHTAVEVVTHSIIEGDHGKHWKEMHESSVLIKANGHNGTWGSMNDQPICLNGIWQEESLQSLLDGETHPHVQCWRDPPCVRWSWLTFDNCRKLRDDADWPTADPIIKELPDNLQSFDDLTSEFFENKTVVFVGDSTNRIVWHAALCEAAKSEKEAWAYVAPGPAAAAALNGGAAYALPQRLAALEAYNAAEKAKGASFWDEPLVHADNGAILLHKGIGHYSDPQEVEALLALADVVVINMGNEYNGKQDEYLTDMSDLFAQLEEFAKEPGKTAVFRESGAQHFNAEGSFATWDESHPTVTKGCQCEALTRVDEPTEVDNLNNIARKLHRAHPRIGFMHYYELTAPRHNLHEESFCAFGHKDSAPACCDCQHFCYTPQMWKVFFSELAEQMRRHQAHGHRQELHRAVWERTASALG